MNDKSNMYPLVPGEEISDAARDFVSSPAIQAHFAGKSAVREEMFKSPEEIGAELERIRSTVNSVPKAEVADEQAIVPPATEPKV